MRMKHTCINCCYKHLSNVGVRMKEIMNFYKDLSVVRVLMKEVVTGYDTEEYHSYIIGHLACAQEHMLDYDLDIAREIRDLRLYWYPEGIITTLFRKDDFDKINDLIKRVGNIIQPTKTTAASIRKPCGCSKRAKAQEVTNVTKTN